MQWLQYHHLRETLLHPASPWIDAGGYAQSFYPIQTAPFFGGFFLVGGDVVLMTATLMIANGVVSIAGGIVTSWSLGWVLTMPGVVSYVGWNILVLALSIYVVLSLRKRQTVIGATPLEGFPNARRSPSH